MSGISFFSSQVMSECLFEKKIPLWKLLCLQQTVIHFLFFSQGLCHKILLKPFTGIKRFNMGSGVLLKFYLGFRACIFKKEKGFQASPSLQWFRHLFRHLKAVFSLELVTNRGTTLTNLTRDNPYLPVTPLPLQWNTM